MSPAAVLIAAAAASASPANVRIADIEARLFYDVTGKLSADILDAKHEFHGWNTVIGEGDSGGSAADALILVKVAAVKPADVETSANQPLTIAAMAGKKLVAKRSYTNILVPYGGATSSLALYLPEIACAGTVIVTAKLGEQVRRATLHMDCGE